MAPGVFALREKTFAVVADEDPDVEDPKVSVITSFGMFWDRDEVNWRTKPELIGMQNKGADHVDFGDQRGVYFLYDFREVIYVGRATDQPLANRLSQHTDDRFKTRWNRFSWFGLRPVSPSGELGDLPDSYDGHRIIPALEAILIEGLEPRQNKRRGDDFGSEYIQKRLLEDGRKT